MTSSLERLDTLFANKYPAIAARLKPTGFSAGATIDLAANAGKSVKTSNIYNVVKSIGVGVTAGIFPLATGPIMVIGQNKITNDKLTFATFVVSMIMIAMALILIVSNVHFQITFTEDLQNKEPEKALGQAVLISALNGIVGFILSCLWLSVIIMTAVYFLRK